MTCFSSSFNSRCRWPPPPAARRPPSPLARGRATTAGRRYRSLGPAAMFARFFFRRSPRRLEKSLHTAFRTRVERNTTIITVIIIIKKKFSKSISFHRISTGSSVARLRNISLGTYYFFFFFLGLLTDANFLETPDSNSPPPTVRTSSGVWPRRE